MTYGGVDIYCKQGDDHFSYIWQTEDYGFEIVSEEELSQNDIQQMLDSVKPN